MTKKKEKILFLWLNDKEFHAVKAKKRDVAVFQTYKKINVLNKILRRIQISVGLNKIEILLNNWKNNFINMKLLLFMIQY